MALSEPIVILDGARRTPRADILIRNREPGLFANFTTTQLGGMAVVLGALAIVVRNDVAAVS